ncbi:DNA replication factor Cdt1 [Galendromus occidentalis]|uniref:DNA replication factor Cdt1 n=1 Tax=Galendromus occidentalis TaxID=34638 RepID=A0AAJ6QRQ1_9ACAR|nr:DNA replication factor Cdt1 [Galendromus occidentalis]
MASTASKKQQQTLTEFFAAKKSSRLTATKQASQALEKLKSLQTDLREIKAKKANLKQDQSEKKSPSYERYASLLEPKLDPPLEPRVVETLDNILSGKIAPVSPKQPGKGKSALARLEAKRAALRSFKEKLSRIESEQQKLKEIREAKELKEVPEVPAHEKYRYLTAPSGTLPLPAHYEKLFNGFTASDTVVSMFHNRKELCRLEKLSQAVRKMTRNNFGLPEVSKILTVKPDAYKITVEQHRFLDTTAKMHHIVDFAEAPEGPKFLMQRKSEFKEKLILNVARYHQQFIDKHMPGSEIPMEALKRWHPKFRLDEIPDITEAEVPKLPDSSETPKAKDILERVRGKFSVRIEKALESLAEKQRKTDGNNNESPGQESSDERAVHGVSKSLLERIKRREALKMAERMVMGGESGKDRRQLQALPNLIRTIRQIFISSQKAALLYTDLVAKINDCGSYDDLDCLMTRLSEIAPEWYKPLKVRNSQYVKIDKERDINIICARVENLAKDVNSAKSL